MHRLNLSSMMSDHLEGRRCQIIAKIAMHRYTLSFPALCDMFACGALEVVYGTHHQI